MADDHLHIYNLRGYCWCGVHRDDWLRNDDMLDKIGRAFRKMNEDAESAAYQSEEKEAGDGKG